MTHALINNTVSIFIVRVELCYLSSHAQREPPLSLSSTISNRSIHYIVAKYSCMHIDHPMHQWHETENKIHSIQRFDFV